MTSTHEFVYDAHKMPYVRVTLHRFAHGVTLWRDLGPNQAKEKPRNLNDCGAWWVDPRGFEPLTPCKNKQKWSGAEIGKNPI
jgi:hypothetical protein